MFVRIVHRASCIKTRPSPEKFCYPRAVRFSGASERINFVASSVSDDCIRITGYLQYKYGETEAAQRTSPKDSLYGTYEDA